MVRGAIGLSSVLAPSPVATGHACVYAPVLNQFPPITEPIVRDRVSKMKNVIWDRVKVWIFWIFAYYLSISNPI